MTDAFVNALMQLYFNNVAHANVGDASGLQPSSAAGSFYISLHTSAPGATGNQTTNEATYTGYGRVAVARSSGGWTVSGRNASNTSTVTFGQNTGSNQDISHFGIGSDASGTGNLQFQAALDTVRTIATGTAPEFEAGELDIDG